MFFLGEPMVPELRRAFNSGFTTEKYRQFLAGTNRACATEIPFRISETPCFFPQSLVAKMARYGREMVEALMGDAAYRAASAASIPPAFNVPNETEKPLFVQVDFGLVRDSNGEIQPKLVELQGFPSLYGYQSAVSHEYMKAYDLPEGLKIYLGGLDASTYRETLRRAVLGDCDPENVVLMEVNPEQQKTLADFKVTERMCNIQTVNITDIVKQGRRLFYPRHGQLVPIERIYNRCIVDELVRTGARLPFDFSEPLDVQWAGHPNWYFHLSKFSIPFIQHPCVPKTFFLSGLSELPADRQNYLLKPLYSFAGAGIIFAPSDEQIAAIPAKQRSQYILQEYINFTPVIETPHGATQAEVRIMYIWLQGLLPVLMLVRMGRGKMMGVDHNRNLEWVGGSAGLMAEGI